MDPQARVAIGSRAGLRGGLWELVGLRCRIVEIWASHRRYGRLPYRWKGGLSFAERACWLHGGAAIDEKTKQTYYSSHLDYLYSDHTPVTARGSIPSLDPKYPRMRKSFSQ